MKEASHDKDVTAAKPDNVGLMLSPEPTAAIEKLNCPFIFTSSDPSMLERIKALLPDANAMGSVGRLNSTIDTLRRDGMAKSSDCKSSCRRLLPDRLSRKHAH